MHADAELHRLASLTGGAYFARSTAAFRRG